MPQAVGMLNSPEQSSVPELLELLELELLELLELELVELPVFVSTTHPVQIAAKLMPAAIIHCVVRIEKFLASPTKPRRIVQTNKVL